MKTPRKTTATAARLSVLQAALAMAATRVQGLTRKPKRSGLLRRKQKPSGPPKSRLAMMAGGGAIAAGIVTAFLRRRSGSEEAAAPSGPAPAPLPNNADVSGPPANTSTPVAAPVVADTGAIDEEAEVQAAAAEAANIGATSAVTPLTSSDGSAGDADPAEQAMLEHGGGESEGQEQTEAHLSERG